ncbi:MAG: hypothetical protein AB1Z31_02690, partial [Desulfobacterales bacterium]
NPRKVYLYRYKTSKRENTILELSHLDGNPFSVKKVEVEHDFIETALIDDQPVNPCPFLPIMRPLDGRTKEYFHLSS